ncbi:uncharacterized protein M6B38_287855 [Iris pallida]|uniref:Uncharacterized protein n=1 Tax=Iris pallida TaxID=29817 RepID=A0AAX6HYJ2_IRIPA|nr:uncharacterized protein M6B38_287855 [Iris pallida]
MVAEDDGDGLDKFSVDAARSQVMAEAVEELGEVGWWFWLVIQS